MFEVFVSIMTCPICNSDMIVDTLYGTSNPKIVIQGYVCDDCGHDWEAIKQLEDWHGKYD